jgi:hypothetical protein
MLYKLTVSILAACLSGATFAAGSGSSVDSTGDALSTDFKTLDKNQDGKLTTSELDGQPALKEDLARIDGNNDGVIDRAEFSLFETRENPDTSSDPRSNPGTGMGTEPTTNPGTGTGGGMN